MLIYRLANACSAAFNLAIVVETGSIPNAVCVGVSTAVTAACAYWWKVAADNAETAVTVATGPSPEEGPGLIRLS